MPSFNTLEKIYDGMMWHKNSYYLSKLKKIFKSEETRFILLVGVKVSAISFCITSMIYFFLFEIMRLNYAFFKSQGVQDPIDFNLFFDFIVNESLDNIIILIIFHIILFFIGTYVGWLILRPFKTIGDYCDEVLSNANAVYRIDDFSNYKLLTRFSEFFFEYLRESRKRGEIISNSIPPQFSRIHRPVNDKIFMLHFGILMLIICISSAVFIIENSSSVYYSLVELSSRILTDQKAMSSYLSNQMFILDDIVVVTIFMIIFGYVLLAIHLYAKVSGAAFGIFSTMRSYMKGDYSSRVHLVGHTYLREYTRKLNKYLDYIQNNFVKKPMGD